MSLDVYLTRQREEIPEAAKAVALLKAMKQQPDLDKLAAQLASDVLNIRGPDRLERIKAEAKEALVAATEQQAQKLATVERRLAMLESAVAHASLDDESE